MYSSLAVRRGLSVREGGLKRKAKSEYYFDFSLVVAVMFFLGFGLLMIYSTSSYEAGKTFHDTAHYLKKQSAATVVGVIAMTVFAIIPYKLWQKFAFIGYIVSIISILLVLSPIGVEAKGARRWITLGFGFNIQPAEIAKLCMIIFLASLVTKIGRNIQKTKGFLIVLAMPLPICLLLWRVTNNMSSAVIVFGIAALMVFVASKDYKKFFLMLLFAAILIVISVLAIKRMGEGDAESLGSFRYERVLAWLNPEAYASGKGFQTLQSLYAIGSGGVLGKGLGQSMQKLGFIPEAQNDMIFSIICEELGIFGALLILFLFLFLLWRLMVIANNAPDLYGGLIVVGVMGHIAIQVILNIAVVTNTIPNTGISLPFISYGGSSVVFLLIEIGMALSVSRSIRFADV